MIIVASSFWTCHENDSEFSFTWGVLFSLVSVCLPTPFAGQATYAAGGMPLAVSQEDFLVTRGGKMANVSFT